jgi:hypothetical protein
LLLLFFREKTTRFVVILFFREATLVEMVHGIYRRSSRADTMQHRIHLYSDAIPQASRGTISKEVRLHICLALRMRAVSLQQK